MLATSAARLKPTVNGRAICCLALALVLVAACVFFYVQNGDNGGRVAELSGKLTEAADARAQLDTLNARLDKRDEQLREAKAALDAAPADTKLQSKLDRAQQEYDKALKNRDKQAQKMAGMETADELTENLKELKESSAGRLAMANAFIALAVLSVALALTFAVDRVKASTLLSMLGMAVGAALIVIGIHQNNLSPALSPEQVMPGTGLIAAGMICAALAHVAYWSVLTHAKLDGKLLLGAALCLAAGALVVTGFLKNNVPNVKAEYINDMSPGLLYLLGGAVTLILGTLVVALPFTRIRYDLRKNPVLVLMALPSIVFFLITAYLPMVGIYFAFTNYRFTTNFFSTLFGSQYVGLDNFRFLFTSGLAWRMTANTIIYNLIFIVGGTILKVGIAIMFSEISGKRYKKFVQTATFLPHFISMVMVGTFAYSMLNFNNGIINATLRRLFGPNAAVNFYDIPWAWYLIIPLVDFWKGVGYGSIIYVSAITGISDELYEAADLDGASFMQEIRHITIPSIRPIIVILTLMSLGNIMRGNFDLFYQLLNEPGKLMNTTEIIDTYVWRSLRQNVQIGRGSAAGLYQSFVGMALVVLVNTIVKKIEPDYAIF